MLQEQVSLCQWDIFRLPPDQGRRERTEAFCRSGGGPGALIPFRSRAGNRGELAEEDDKSLDPNFFGTPVKETAGKQRVYRPLHGHSAAHAIPDLPKVAHLLRLAQ